MSFRLMPLILAAASCAAAAPDCAGLKSLSIPHTTFTLAEVVPEGKFVPPGAPPQNAGPGYRCHRIAESQR